MIWLSISSLNCCSIRVITSISSSEDSDSSSEDADVNCSLVIPLSIVLILGVLVKDCNDCDILLSTVLVGLIFCTNSYPLFLGRLLGWKWGADISFGKLVKGFGILSTLVLNTSIC